MTHFFILGSHPALSLAELFSRLPITEYEYIAPELLVAQLADAPEAKSFMASVGGVIKMGRLETALAPYPETILEKSLKVLEKAAASSKLNFGISAYGKMPFDRKRLGLQLKTLLKDKGVSSRFVTSNDKTLSSVVVEQNKLTGSGRELVYIPNGKKIWLGVSEAVQPFKELSARDYGRPARDDRSGMLPPKVAQIMLNLSAAGEHDAILDPFCGSGTVLTEAMAMGFKNLYGSDISKKAIADTRRNLEWTAQRYGSTAAVKLTEADARRLAAVYSQASIAAIVAETYLGPQRGAVDVKKVGRELSALYEQFAHEAARILKKGGRLVLALPAFRRNGVTIPLELRLKGFRTVSVLPAELHSQLALTPRHSFLYGRADQRVWREILVLEKSA